MASLIIQSVGKCYEQTRAIADVSLEVADGEFLVLVGPSGCGKSTLLRMIAGLEGLTEGRIRLGERDVSDVDPKDRDVAMVFQNYALYPHMSVFQNMAFGLEQRKIPKARIRQSVMEAARILDLEELIDRKPGALSGGQSQRVAMGRAIVRNPAIYLMDEPLSNLDAKLRVQMRAQLKLLRARLGVTTVYVTHDQVEAMTLGDRVAVMAPYSVDGGSNLQQCDTAQALYLQPRNLFVAGFIGSPAMNFVYADLVGDGASIQASIVGTEECLQLTPANTSVFEALRRRCQRRVVIGIRPEFLSLASDDVLIAGTDAGSGGRDSRHCLAVDVLVSERVGPDAYLYFNLPTPEVTQGARAALDDSRDAIHLDARFTARVASEKLRVESGAMHLLIELSRLMFFDVDSGDRLIS